jgi:hypothetical protein
VSGRRGSDEQFEPIAPEAALRPGRRDPLALLAVWYVRKASYPLLWLGIIVAMLAGRADAIDLGLHSPQTIVARLLSPLAGIILAVLLRIGAGLAGLALAYPLARAREASLSPRTYFGAAIGRLSDRLNVARAYRALRWTHHVRQVAIRRLGETGLRLSRLDPVLDVAGVALFLAIPVFAVALSAQLVFTA